MGVLVRDARGARFGEGMSVQTLSDIKLPIGKDEKELVEKMRDKDGFKPNPSKEDKSFFDKLKDLF